MKRILPFVAASVSALTALLAPSSAEAALYSYFPLDTISDGATTPNAVTGATAGTLSDNGFTLFSSGGRNGVSSNGGGRYIAAGSTAPFGVGTTHSWSFWTYQNAEHGNAPIIGNRGDGNGASGSAGDGRWFKFQSTMFNWNSNAGQITPNYGSVGNIPNGQWVHHAAVQNGSTITYYRNGILAQTATVGGAPNVDSYNFQLFGDRDYTSERWNGALDDVALFSHALSAAEIRGLATGALNPLNVPEPARALLPLTALLGFLIRRKRA